MSPKFLFNFQKGEMRDEKPSDSSLRKSPRLEEMGYYDENGLPTVSYKERLRSVFKRRRKHKNNMIWHDMEEQDFFIDDVPVKKPSFTFPWPIFLFFLFMFSIGGTAYIVNQRMHNTLRNYKETVEVLSAKVRDLDAELSELRRTVHPQALSMPNFALGALGAYVVRDLSSKTYQTEPMNGWRSWIVPRLIHKTACNVISGQNYPLTPDHCWKFEGQKGHLFIGLAAKIHITYVTLGHITEEQSPTGEIMAAPKQFTVYGLKTHNGEEIKLGTFEYNNKGDSFQTFKIENYGDEVFSHVRLEVDSNYGSPVYTCLYTFRVHGHRP